MQRNPALRGQSGDFLAAVERQRVGNTSTASNFAARIAAKAAASLFRLVHQVARDFRADAARGILRHAVLDQLAGVLGIGEQRDALRCRQQLLQHLHPLGAQLCSP
jgi:hypothetical protein